MTLDKAYFIYMATVGIVSGAVLIRYPGAADYVIGPFLWVLIGVALFDALLFVTRRHPAALSMNARMIGFGIGIALMVGARLAAGI